MRFQSRVRLTNAAASSDLPEACFRERHYSVPEIAEIWNLSRDVVRKIFEGEPGVLVIGDDSSRSKRGYHTLPIRADVGTGKKLNRPRGKRGYHTLRIPESVAERVHRRLCNPDLTPAQARAYSSGKSGPPVAVNN